jgi:competence protein ComEC
MEQWGLDLQQESLLSRLRQGLHQARRPQVWRGWGRELAEEIWNRPLAVLAVLFYAALQALFLPRGECLGMAGRVVLWGMIGVGAGLVVGKVRRREAVGILLLILIAGTLRAHWVQAQRIDVADLTGRGLVLWGMVDREQMPTSSGVSFVIEAQKIRLEGKERAAKGMVAIYCPRSQQVNFGDVVEITGRMGQSLAPGHVTTPTLSVPDARLMRNLGKKPEGLAATAGHKTRVGLVETLRRALPASYRELNAQLLASLMLGAQGAGIPREVVAAFRQTGTIHVLVVSGTQISLLFAVVYSPGMLAQWRRRRMLRKQIAKLADDQHTPPKHAFGAVRVLPAPLVVMVALVMMCIYAMLTQGGTSIARAAIMGGLIGLVYLLARWGAVADRHGLDIDRYTILGAALVGILLVDPEAVNDIGFQLSFAAVAGIAFLAPRLRELLRSWNDIWAYLLAAPVAAQCAVLPVLAWHFGQAPIIGFVSNIPVVPIAAILLWLGLATFVVGAIWSPLAIPLGWVCWQLSWLMMRTIEAFARVPKGMLPVYNYTWWQMAEYAMVVIAGGLLLGVLLKEKDEGGGMRDEPERQG